MEKSITNQHSSSENLNKNELIEAKQPAHERFLSYCVASLKKNSHIDFKVDDDNRSVVEALCLYHTNNPLFELMNPDWFLEKGILLFGPVGSGKTTLMHLFRDSPKAYTRYYTVRSISAKYSSEGIDAITKFDTNERLAFNGSAFNHQMASYCFDDLGTESVAMHFGQPCNVMADIISNRYDNRLPFSSTHITTNLSAEQIKEMYGLRVYDRMKEMFNLIVLKGTSRRTSTPHQYGNFSNAAVETKMVI